MNPSTKITTPLKLYVYGSCQSDQYYHPKGENQSKKPICLTSIPQFAPSQDEEQKRQPIPNPLFTQKVLKIACGGLHTIVLTTEGKAYTFGCNDQGALGRTGVQRLPGAVELDEPIDLIAAGDNHSLFANSTSGSVFFSGNYKYLRGEKMTEPTRVPVKFHISSLDVRVKDAKIDKIVSGANHSCILIGGRIFCRGEPEAYTTGRRINERRKTQNSLTFDGVGLSHVVDVWCGGYHTIAKIKKRQNYTYWTWGLNTHGQLGINSYKLQMKPTEIKKLRNIDVVDVAAGTNFTIFLTKEGEVFGCGQNQYGQMGRGKNYVYQQEDQLNVDITQKLNLKSNDEGDKHDEPVLSQGVSQPMTSQGVSQPMMSQGVSQPDKQASDPMQAESPAQKIRGQNLYIKTIIPIPIDEKITAISAGSEFVFAWTNKQLYSWGFAMNYVLLNGEEQDEYVPFKVKPRIINEQILHELKAGGQHVVYTAYVGEGVNLPQISMDVQTAGFLERKRLSRRRK